MGSTFRNVKGVAPGCVVQSDLRECDPKTGVLTGRVYNPKTGQFSNPKGVQ